MLKKVVKKMMGNLEFISKSVVLGHSIQIASYTCINGCKTVVYVVEVGYMVAYSVDGEDFCLRTKDVEEAIRAYNEIDFIQG